MAAPAYSLEASGGLVGEEGAARREEKLSIYHLGYHSVSDKGLKIGAKRDIFELLVKT